MEYITDEYKKCNNIPQLINFLFSDRNRALEHLRNRNIPVGDILQPSYTDLKYVLLFAFYPDVYEIEVTQRPGYEYELTIIQKCNIFPYIADDYVYRPSFIKQYLTVLNMNNFSIADIDIGERVNDLDYLTTLLNEHVYLTCFNNSIHRELILESIEKDRVYYPIIDGKIQNIHHYIQDLIKDRRNIKKNKYFPYIILAAFNELGRDAIYIAIESIGKMEKILNKQILELEGVWELVTKYRCAIPVYSDGISRERAVEFIESCPHLYRIYQRINVPELNELLPEINHAGLLIDVLIDSKSFKNGECRSRDLSVLPEIKELSELNYLEIDKNIRKRVGSFIADAIFTYFNSETADNKEKELIRLIFKSPTLMKILARDTTGIAFNKPIHDKVEITNPKVAKYYIEYSRKIKVIDPVLFEKIMNL